jgi:hypothetical protein
MLEILIGSAIMMPVSSVLSSSDLFLTGGGSTWETIDCNPDWGAGKTNAPRNKVGRAKAIVLGDTKYRWSHLPAINIVRSSRGGYTQENVRPIEQVQHYCAMYGCRFGFVITEAGALVMQFFKEREIQRSPRPQRNITQPSHRRITSSSTMDMSSISASLTDMSLTSDDLSAPTIRLVQYAFVPWDAHGAGTLTVKLALYCLTLLAKDDSVLGPDYAPLVSQLPLNVDLKSSSHQPGMQAAGSLRKEQAQEQSTDASMAQQYTDVALTEHLGYITFSLNSKATAKHKDEWRKEGDYLFHDSLRVKGKKPQSTTTPGSTGASMAQQYTDVTLSEHANYITFSLNSKVTAKHKDEWRKEGDYLFHDSLRVKGKKP